jgi:putative effector of murein hydrolase LrgA (UPF0299 family)
MILQHISCGVEMCKQAVILMIAKFLMFGNPCYFNLLLLFPATSLGLRIGFICEAVDWFHLAWVRSTAGLVYTE